MNKYALPGKLTALEGKVEDLAEILLKASEIVSGAAGCHLYVISKDRADPDSVWITEIWDTKEDHDESLKLPAVRELIGQVMPLLNGMPEKGQELEVLGGLGLK